MFVRRLVSGVRSSCDASDTSCRCAPVDSSSAAEHRVEAGEPAELVLAARHDALREVAGLGDPLGRRGQAADGREGGAGDEQPRLQRQRSPPAAMMIRTAGSGRACGRPRSGTGHLDRVARATYGNVITRTCVPATSAS